MKICNICHKLSATDQNHTDCVEKMRIELEDDEFKRKLPEKLDMTKNTQDLGVEVKAILEHLTKEKNGSKDS